MNKSLARSSIYLMGIRVIGVLFQVLTTVLLARNLELSEMGQFAVIYAGLGLARVLGPIGVDQACLRLISQVCDGSAIPDEAQRLSLASIGLVLTYNCVIPLGLVALYLAGVELGQGVLYFAAAAPAYVMIGLFVGQVRGLGYNASAQIPEAIGLQGTILGFILLCHIFGDLALIDTYRALLFSGWLALFLQLGIRWFIGFDRKCTPKRETYILLIVEGWGMFQAQAFTALAMRAPVFLATALLGSAATAIVEVALRFGNLPSILTGSVGATYSTRYAQLASNGDKLGLKAARTQAGLLSGVPSLIYLLLCGTFGWAIFEAVFPPEYKSAFIPLMLVALGSVVNAFFGPASNVFLMSGRANLVRSFSILRLAAVVAVSLTAGAIFGSAGIAAGILAGFVLRDIGLTYMASREGI